MSQRKKKLSIEHNVGNLDDYDHHEMKIDEGCLILITYRVTPPKNRTHKLFYCFYKNKAK